MICTVYYKSQWFKKKKKIRHEIFFITLFFFSIDLYKQRIKPFNESGKNWPVLCRTSYTHLHNQMINCLAKQTSFLPTENKWADFGRWERVKKIMFPFVSYTFFVQTYSETSCIYIYIYYTHTQTNRTGRWTHLNLW